MDNNILTSLNAHTEENSIFDSALAEYREAAAEQETVQEEIQPASMENVTPPENAKFMAFWDQMQPLLDWTNITPKKIAQLFFELGENSK